MKPNNIQIRMAKAKDEPRLADLVDFTGLPPVNWEGAHPNWIVAEVDGEIVGTIQIALARPVGHAEFLNVDLGLTGRERFWVSLKLSKAAEYALKSTGSDFLTAVVRFENKGFKKLLKKHFGGRVVNQGNVIVV